MTPAMRLEPHCLQILVPTSAASKQQLSSEEQAVDNTTESTTESSTDMDFFQSCPLGGSPGFKLNCWEKKISSRERTVTKSMPTNSSLDFNPDDYDWGDDCSFYSVEEQDSSSISASEDEDEHDEISLSSGSSSPRSDRQAPEEDTRAGKEHEQKKKNEEDAKDEERDLPFVANKLQNTISLSAQILEPHFQAAVDQMSSEERHVHFGSTMVTAEFTYEKPSNDDFFRLYYSAHELQRLQDQYKIDLCCCSSSSASSGTIHSASAAYHTRTEDGVVGASDREEDGADKQVDYCLDYPVW